MIEAVVIVLALMFLAAGIVWDEAHRGYGSGSGEGYK